MDQREDSHNEHLMKRLIMTGGVYADRSHIDDELLHTDGGPDELDVMLMMQ